ncbi:MAG: hypothetical protein ACM3WU_08845 [Bacillota bacterium]
MDGRPYRRLLSGSTAAVPDHVLSLVRPIRKVRKLPLPGEVLVSVGQSVEPETDVARIALRPGIPWVIPAARLLGIEPDALRGAMLCPAGCSVKARQVIARVEQGIYGRKELESPADGVIEEISTRSGRITIREEFGREDPPIDVDVAFELQCKPEDIGKYMLRSIGQEVKKQQMLAKKGEAQAFFTKTALSPVSGVVSKIDTKSGKVTISRPFKQVVIKAYMSGTVTEVLSGQGCVVETAGVRLTGAFGLGRETSGVIRVLTSSPDEDLTPDLIGEDCRGAIIVAGAHLSSEALAKAMKSGAKGIVAGTAGYMHLTGSLGLRLGVGITGQEDIDLTVILTEGFGRLPMREATWAALKALEGMRASMNGATQIRAGAIRPEIVVPFPDCVWSRDEEIQPVSEDLSPGTAVRIVTAPYFGEMGRVAELRRQPEALETETLVPVVRVTLERGETVTVARANVEVL